MIFSSRLEGLAVINTGTVNEAYVLHDRSRFDMESGLEISGSVASLVGNILCVVYLGNIKSNIPGFGLGAIFTIVLIVAAAINSLTIDVVNVPY